MKIHEELTVGSGEIANFSPLKAGPPEPRPNYLLLRIVRHTFKNYQNELTDLVYACETKNGGEGTLRAIDL